MVDRPALTAALSSVQRQGCRLEASYTGIVGLVIAVLRREKGWSQNQLSKLSDVSQPTISRLEVGETDITIPQLDALATSLGTTPGFILEAADSIRSFFQGTDTAVRRRKPHSIIGAMPADNLVDISGGLFTGGQPGFLIATILSSSIISSRREKR